MNGRPCIRSSLPHYNLVTQALHLWRSTPSFWVVLHICGALVLSRGSQQICILKSFCSKTIINLTLMCWIAAATGWFSVTTWQDESGTRVSGLRHAFLVFGTSPGLRVALPVPPGDPVWRRSDGDLQLKGQTVVRGSAGSNQVRNQLETNQRTRMRFQFHFLCVLLFVVFFCRATSDGSQVGKC